MGVVLADKIGLHLNREQNDSLSFNNLETEAQNIVSSFEVSRFLAAAIF